MEINKSKIALLILLCNIWACDQPKSSSAAAVNPEINKQTAIDSADLTSTALLTDTGYLERALIESGLVDIQSLDSTVLVDLRYSSTNNFVGVDVYGDLKRCYLQKEVALKLVQAQAILREEMPGFHLLVFDGARPLHVQQIFWDTLDKPEEIKHLYVADPRIGSIHNYGSAVDLTIVDDHGRPLDMGTDYDFFGELAYPSKEQQLMESGLLSLEQVENRRLLRRVMSKAGFSSINTEWWHYNAYSRDQAAALYDIIP